MNYSFSHTLIIFNFHIVHVFIDSFQRMIFSNLVFSFPSDNILISEEKQRILLLERVSRHLLSFTLHFKRKMLCFWMYLYLFNQSNMYCRLYT